MRDCTALAGAAIDAGAPARVDRRRWAALIAALAALALAAPAIGYWLASNRGAEEIVPSRSVPAAKLSAVSSARVWAQLPPLARLAISRGVGSVEPAYWATRAGSSLQARNPAERFTAGFVPGGVTVSDALGRLGLSLRSLRAGGRSVALAAALPAPRANRVSYDRGAISEWYANGPLGLEQGFSVARAAGSSLALSVALHGRGLRARAAAGGIDLLAGRRVAWRYGGLAAADARGRTLPAWMSLRGSTVVLHVRTAGASFPVLVDPTLTPVIQQGVLTAGDGAASDAFGQSVAVSGSVIAVGAQGATAGGQQGAGAVYVFSEPATGWASTTSAAKLTASAPQSGAGLGTSVAISGTTILAGAPMAGAGTVLLFNEPTGGWASENESGNLNEPSPGTSDEFGASLAASGGTVVVGAPLWNNFSGSVDVYTKPSSGWATEGQAAQLTTTASGYAGLGWSVAMSGSTVVAGAPLSNNPAGNNLVGQLMVYTEPASGWANATQTALLSSSTGMTGDGLGQSVGVSGTTVVGGAASATVGSNSDQGIAYLFTEPATGGWANATESARLEAPSGSANDSLGASVAVSGPEAFAGAPGSQVGSNTAQGATYVFSEPQGGWPVGQSPSPAPVIAPSSTLTEATGSVGDAFGWSAAISGSSLVVGANAETVNGQNAQGTAVIFNGVTQSTGPGGTSNPPGTSGPTGPGGSALRNYATVTAVSGGPARATVSLKCTATAGKCVAANALLVIEEKLVGKRIVATQAKAKPRTKTTLKRVTVGAAHVTLAARAHATLVVNLNPTGRALLGPHAKMAVGVSVSSVGRVLRLATVTITHPAPAKKGKSVTKKKKP